MINRFSGVVVPKLAFATVVLGQSFLALFITAMLACGLYGGAIHAHHSVDEISLVSYGRGWMDTWDKSATGK